MEHTRSVTLFGRSDKLYILDSGLFVVDLGGYLNIYNKSHLKIFQIFNCRALVLVVSAP